MKILISLILIFSGLSFSQIPLLMRAEIEKQGVNTIDPDKFYYLYAAYGNVLYVISDNACWILKDNLDNTADLMNALPVNGNAASFIRAEKNKMLLATADSLYYYNNSDPFNPVLINKWLLPENLLQIYFYGDYFVFRQGTNYNLMDVKADSIKLIAPVVMPQITYGLLAMYPYVIRNGQSGLFYLYKMASDFSFYLSNYLQLNSVVAWSCGNPYLALYQDVTPTYPGGPPNRRLKIYKVTDSEFTLVLNKDFSPLIGMQNYVLLAVTDKYFAMKGTAENLSGFIYHISGQPSYTYNKDYKIHLGNSKYYAYNRDLYIANNRYDLNSIIPEYYFLPFTGTILSRKGNTVKSGKNNLSNTFQFSDSVVYSGNVYARDSLFYINKDSLIREFSVRNGKIVLRDSAVFSSGFTRFDKYGDYLFAYFESLFEIHRRSGGSFLKIYSSPEYTQVSKIYYKDNFFYLADINKGVVKFELSPQNTVTKKWEKTGNQSYAFAVSDDRLIIKENKTLFLYNISQNDQDPVMLDSALLPSEYYYVDFITTANNIYLRALNNRSVLIKLSLNGNSFGPDNYFFQLPGYIEPFSLVEENQKIIVAGNNFIYWIKDTSVVLEAEKNDPELPDGFSLSQNFPNPFNPETIISYTIPDEGKVSLKIYDILGTEVAALVNEFKEAGNHRVVFNASALPSGIYFCKLEYGFNVKIKKMVFLK